MSKAYKQKQIFFMLDNKAGLLAKVTDIITGAGINMEDICAFSQGSEANFLIISEDNAEALGALKAAGIEATEVDVTAVELVNHPGELDRIAKKMAVANINILYMYATTTDSETATVIFKTEDEDVTIAAIND